MIVFGPFLTRSEYSAHYIDRFVYTGYTMELVADGEHHMMPIYLDASHLNGQYASFDNFYFPEPPSGWPVAFKYRSLQERQTHFGLFVAISPVLAEIFHVLKPPVRMEDFLREFRSLIPVSGNREVGYLYKPKRTVNLSGKLTAQGYTVAGIMSYGVRLSVDIAWSFGDDYPGWQNIAAGHMEFRPRCGKLDDGKWSRRGCRRRIEDHFSGKFAAAAPDKPIDCFRSAEDLEALLSHFEWTPTTRHSAREIREMRIAMVKSAAHLWDSPKDLAALLLQEGLYSGNTSIHQIVKSLPSLMREAGAGGSAHGDSTAAESTPRR